MNRKNNYDVILDGCREGKSLIVAACLIEAGDSQDELITRLHNSKEGEVYTPFMIAVRNGHFQLVRLLLEQFHVDVNGHRGVLNFDGYLIEDASPLWVATACGYCELVKLLVLHGAAINETTSTNSTPLRAACFHGKLSVVIFLMENGADSSITNRYHNTCLMVSCYRGNLEVMEYLLSRGVDVDAQANCGSTALHLACETGRLTIVQSLVNAGCDMTLRNKAGLTAAMVAADGCHSDVIEFFTKQPSVDPTTQVELLELLGASFANDKDRYNTEKTYHYLFLAMLIRSKEKIAKRVEPVVEAYNNRCECQNIRELQAIHHDQDAIHMEALIVRERILGARSAEIIHPIVYRGAVYADGLQFNRCIKLWRRALLFRQSNARPAHNDLLRFAEVFSQMILLNERIDPSDLLDILHCCVEESKKSNADLNKHQKMTDRLLCGDEQETADSCCREDLAVSTHDFCSVCEDNPSLSVLQANVASSWKRIETNLHTALYLIFVVCKVLGVRDSDPAAAGADQLLPFRKLVYKFIKLDIRDINRSTLLHLAVNERTPVDDFHVKDICSFPNADVAAFLLSCGADANARDAHGNSPLHVIVQYEKPISDFLTLHMVISRLLDHGSHLDACNGERRTPHQLATTGVAEIILKTQGKRTLQCACACVIRQHQLAFRGRVPDFIADFIAMH